MYNYCTENLLLKWIIPFVFFFLDLSLNLKFLTFPFFFFFWRGDTRELCLNKMFLCHMESYLYMHLCLCCSYPLERYLFSVPVHLSTYSFALSLQNWREIIILQNVSEDTDDMYDELFNKYGKVVFRRNDQKPQSAEVDDDAESLSCKLVFQPFESKIATCVSNGKNLTYPIPFFLAPF